MENGIGRPIGRSAGTSFDRFTRNSNSFSNNSNNNSNYNSYNSYSNNNNNHSSNHSNNHPNNYGFPTPDYSKRNNYSFNNSSLGYKNNKSKQNTSNNPSHLAQLQQNAQAAGKSFAATVQRPNFFADFDNGRDSGLSGFFTRSSNQGTPSPTYSGTSLLGKSKQQPRINSKTEFPTLGGNSLFGNSLQASKSNTSGFASALTGAPKEQSDFSPSIITQQPTIVAKPSNSSPGVSVTVKKKTNSGGSSGKKKNINKAKEFLLTDSSNVLDKNNNQISSEGESPVRVGKTSKKEKKEKKESKKEKKESGKKIGKKKHSSEKIDQGKIENGDSPILNEKNLNLWNMELEQQLIKEMRARCHDCFAEEDEELDTVNDKMITDSEIQEMQEFMQTIKNRN